MPQNSSQQAKDILVTGPKRAWYLCVCPLSLPAVSQHWRGNHKAVGDQQQSLQRGCQKEKED